MDIIKILKAAVELKASDLHITVGLPPMLRIDGILKPYNDIKLKPDDTRQIAENIMSAEQLEKFEDDGEHDFSYLLNETGRFRVNAYRQKNHTSIAFRLINDKIPTIDSLGLPECLKDLSLKPRGLVLVTGPTGSGKSTTLAAMVNHINTHANCHVLTLEEPIEYVHHHKKSMINQREIGTDSKSFNKSLRSALREDPDVILVGEMRDPETISTVITAAETGHLVMSTLHTTGSAQTIDRIIDVFPPHQQQQVKIQLASVLQGVICQQLLPTADGRGRVAALEILIANNAVRNLVREGKTHQIPSIIQSSIRQEMRSMDYSLAELVKKNVIAREEAQRRCVEKDMLRRYMMH